MEDRKQEVMTEKKTKVLTEMQEKFLDFLFDEAKGNFKVAKAMAGYAESVPVRTIVRSLKNEIYELAMEKIASAAPEAAYELANLVTDPGQANAVVKMKAAQEVLNRAGIQTKTEDVKLNIPTGGLVILPAKRTSNEETE